MQTGERKTLKSPNPAKRERNRLLNTAAWYEIDSRLAPQINPRDSLFVAGFWRSGTTWLMESLAESLTAKTVFEPLQYFLPDMQPIYTHLQVLEKGERFLRYYMPYCAGTLENPLHDYFDLALRSALPRHWIRSRRQELAVSRRARVVLKCIFSQLCLRAVQNTFHLPVIHIYRDPRAVIASMKKTRNFQFFAAINVSRQLLKSPDGRAEFFGRWRDEIKDYSKQDGVVQLAAYWALTEKFVQHSFADKPARAVFISYEDLGRRRESLLEESLQQLGLSALVENGVQVLADDSSTTSQQQRGATVTQRISGWRQVLSASEIATIESITKKFGFEDRLVS